MTEIYKNTNGVAPPITNTLFEFQSNEYNIRNFQVLSTDFSKLAASLEEFKEKIKKWKCDTCPGRSCKTFQPNLGFINQKYGFKKCEFALFYYIFFF